MDRAMQIVEIGRIVDGNREEMHRYVDVIFDLIGNFSGQTRQLTDAQVSAVYQRMTAERFAPAGSKASKPLSPWTGLTHDSKCKKCGTVRRDNQHRFNGNMRTIVTWGKHPCFWCQRYEEHDIAFPSAGK